MNQSIVAIIATPNLVRALNDGDRYLDQEIFSHNYIFLNKKMSEQSYLKRPLSTSNGGTSYHPRNVKEIEAALSAMDKKNGTSFKSWIRDSENLSYLCSFKKDLFEEYYKVDPQYVINALSWLTKDWSLSSISELLLKLFYSSDGMESEKFLLVVKGLTQDWERLRKVELVNVLLIGETASISGKFCSRYVGGWDSMNDIRFFLEELFVCLRWKEDFLFEFLTNFVTDLRSSQLKGREDLFELEMSYITVALEKRLQQRHDAEKTTPAKLTGRPRSDSNSTLCNEDNEECVNLEEENLEEEVKEDAAKSYDETKEYLLFGIDAIDMVFDILYVSNNIMEEEKNEACKFNKDCK